MVYYSWSNFNSHHSFVFKTLTIIGIIKKLTLKPFMMYLLLSVNEDFL